MLEPPIADEARAQAQVLSLQRIPLVLPTISLVPALSGNQIVQDNSWSRCKRDLRIRCRYFIAFAISGLTTLASVSALIGPITL
jgi:hypothetical protein